jgi:peptidoglycan-associated lipoprotein
MWSTYVVCGSIALALVAGGCNKKTTNVPSALPPAQEQPTEEVAPAPASTFEPSNDDNFAAMEMDAAMAKAFQTVYFDFDRFDLRPQTVEQLQIVGRFMQEHPSVRVLMEGHCDEPGTDEYNMGLGEKRSRTTRDYLAAYGIDARRLEITSYGKERFAFPNCENEECHGKNRRVEWKVLAR